MQEDLSAAGSARGEAGRLSPPGKEITGSLTMEYPWNLALPLAAK